MFRKLLPLLLALIGLGGGVGAGIALRPVPETAEMTDPCGDAEAPAKPVSVAVPEEGGEAVPTHLRFQDGPINADGNGVNGITHEALLAVLCDRLRGFQKGPYACKANACALTHLEEAQHWLQQRTIERMRRSVEGTHTV